MDEAFHAGEQALQARTGQRERLAEVGSRSFRPAMPGRSPAVFLSSCRGCWWAAWTPAAKSWASAVSGPPGFVQSPDACTLEICAQLPAGDPLADALPAGARIRAAGAAGAHPPAQPRQWPGAAATGGWLAAGHQPELWQLPQIHPATPAGLSAASTQPAPSVAAQQHAQCGRPPAGLPRLTPALLPAHTHTTTVCRRTGWIFPSRRRCGVCA